MSSLHAVCLYLSADSAFFKVFISYLSLSHLSFEADFFSPLFSCLISSNLSPLPVIGVGL